MQDDITDGALYLVETGLVDKNRMCLSGGSYGGYATLQGLIKEPDLFKCGNAFVAVTDLELRQTISWSDTAKYSDYLTTDYKRWVGDKDDDAAQFQATSPARNRRDRSGSSTTPMAMPTTPSGNWYNRSA